MECQNGGKFERFKKKFYKDHVVFETNYGSCLVLMCTFNKKIFFLGYEHLHFYPLFTVNSTHHAILVDYRGYIVASRRMLGEWPGLRFKRHMWC